MVFDKIVAVFFFPLVTFSSVGLRQGIWPSNRINHVLRGNIARFYGLITLLMYIALLEYFYLNPPE